ncbi:hypothetical protein L293_2803 [Acinetobacter gyllenbergii CIP 110306 = MTCC 11365]|nr:hypothetical protein L293_2803 [Acinetobacter gyllenbergii CIP 110306 = MTCC 11365]
MSYYHKSYFNKNKEKGFTPKLLAFKNTKITSPLTNSVKKQDTFCPV